MDIGIMNEEMKKLERVVPTNFVKASCTFWARAMESFTRNLPPQHKKQHLYLNIWSEQALASFKSCCPIGTVNTSAI
jgi:hypothetical protein